MLILKNSKKSIAVENYCKNAFRVKSVGKILKMLKKCLKMHTEKILFRHFIFGISAKM